MRTSRGCMKTLRLNKNAWPNSIVYISFGHCNFRIKEKRNLQHITMDEIIIASLKIEFRVYGYGKEFPTQRNYIMLYII